MSDVEVPRLYAFPAVLAREEDIEDNNGLAMVAGSGVSAAYDSGAVYSMQSQTNEPGTVVSVTEWGKYSTRRVSWIALRTRSSWYLSCDGGIRYSDEEFWARCHQYRVILRGKRGETH